jgi:hypothetical protein
MGAKVCGASGGVMELLSILDWKTDSSDIAKTLRENTTIQMKRVEEMVKQVKPGDFSIRDLIFFAYVQLIPGVHQCNASFSCDSAKWGWYHPCLLNRRTQ